MWSGDLGAFFLRENLSERVILGLRQRFPERPRQGSCLCDIEAFEHPVADETAGAQKRLVDVSGGAVDRADDVEAEEIGEHPVGEVQDRADLVPVVGLSSHEGIVRVFQDDDELAVGIGGALAGPEPDEFRFFEDFQAGGRDKVKPVRVFKLPHEMTQIGGFSGSG